MENKPAIIVSGNKYNMQPWYWEKCKRALEELSHLADCIQRPGNEPKSGWPSKEEEMLTHLSYAVKAVLVMAAISCGVPGKVRPEEVACIVDKGHTGYEEIAGKYLT